MADLLPRDLDLGGHAAHGVLEAELQVVAEIVAALCAGAAAAAGAAEQIAKAEEVAQDIAEVGKSVGVETGGSRAGHAGVPVVVVGGALLRIAEHAVGLGRLLEPLLGLLVVRVAVRVKLERHLPVGALQLLLGDVAADSQNLVVIALGHRCWVTA